MRSAPGPPARGPGRARVGQAAPGPVDGTSLRGRLRAQTMGRAKAALAAQVPGDGTSQGVHGGSGPELDEQLMEATSVCLMPQITIRTQRRKGSKR